MKLSLSTAMLAALLLTGCQTGSEAICPPTEPVTVTEFVEVRPEPVPESALQRPSAPGLYDGEDANVLATNLRRMLAYDGEVTAYIDGLEETIRCRINGDCEGEP
ncbi:hypothetical protein [Henriciella sp.]|uniref:hypothetical protein n=1 Tax=Henriciella sp. TaxID=1968823 RepID=UPI0025C7388F|nr:hypothetical protein [Henriciella sp.]